MINLRTFLRKTFPLAAVVFKRTRSVLSRVRLGDGDVRVFDEIMHENRWQDAESASGTGSRLEQTEKIRNGIPPMLSRLKAQSLLDAPCGDFNWMRLVDLHGIRYIGLDVVVPLIEACQRTYGGPTRRFQVGNILTDPLPRADVILSRDCLVHLSYKHAFAALRNFRLSGATYLLTTTYISRKQNWNIVTGKWRPLNLQARPFKFPPPTELLVEGSTECDGECADKSLGLWPLASLALP
jgi:SAM-dependent methyltransferase